MPDMNENAETQQEYFGLVRTDNTETLKNALNKIAELEAQIEKMKCCFNCSKWYDGECEESPKSKSLWKK